VLDGQGRDSHYVLPLRATDLGQKPRRLNILPIECMGEGNKSQLFLQLFS